MDDFHSTTVCTTIHLSASVEGANSSIYSSKRCLPWPLVLTSLKSISTLILLALSTCFILYSSNPSNIVLTI